LAEPRDSVLVTGVKRNIGLLKEISATGGDHVVALDISLDKNRQALLDLLDLGVSITYVDHHFAGDIPIHPGLRAVIDPSSDVCTSLLVDRMLGGRFCTWAVVGAFGDGLPHDLGPPLLTEEVAGASRQRLEELASVAAAAPPPAPAVNPLEELVREMLRPILKQWLDDHLPQVVDEHVKREIHRITGRPV
jgi:hypothetical protein